MLSAQPGWPMSMLASVTIIYALAKSVLQRPTGHTTAATDMTHRRNTFKLLPQLQLHPGGIARTVLLVRSQRLKLFVHCCDECWMHRCGAMHAT
jgi:hypothetical protein